MGKSKVLAIAPLLLAMYGCSSSDTAVAPPVVPGATSGIFLDAEVEGLSYTTDRALPAPQTKTVHTPIGRATPSVSQ